MQEQLSGSSWELGTAPISPAWRIACNASVSISPIAMPLEECCEESAA